MVIPKSPHLVQSYDKSPLVIWMLGQSAASDDTKVGRSGRVHDGCVRRQAGRKPYEAKQVLHLGKTNPHALRQAGDSQMERSRQRMSQQNLILAKTNSLMGCTLGVLPAGGGT